MGMFDNMMQSMGSGPWGGFLPAIQGLGQGAWDFITQPRGAWGTPIQPPPPWVQPTPQFDPAQVQPDEVYKGRIDPSVGAQPGTPFAPQPAAPQTIQPPLMSGGIEPLPPGVSGALPHGAGELPSEIPPQPPDPMQLYLDEYNARTQEIMESQKQAAMAQMLLGYGGSLLGNIGDPATGMAQGGQHISDWLGRKEQIELLPEARDRELFEQQMAMMKSQGAGGSMPWSERKFMMAYDRIMGDDTLTPEQKMDQVDLLLGTARHVEGGSYLHTPRGIQRGGETITPEQLKEEEATERALAPTVKEGAEAAVSAQEQENNAQQLRDAGYDPATVSHVAGSNERTRQWLGMKNIEYRPLSGAERVGAAVESVTQAREEIRRYFIERGYSEAAVDAELNALSEEALIANAERLRSEQ